MTLTTSPTPTTTATSSATTPVWRVGAKAGLLAAAATTAVAVVAKAIDIPLKAAPHTADAGRRRRPSLGRNGSRRVGGLGIGSPQSRAEIGQRATASDATSSGSTQSNPRSSRSEVISPCRIARKISVPETPVIRTASVTLTRSAMEATG
jgi:hypothetical protein